MFIENDNPTCFFCDRELVPSLVHPGFYVRECECNSDFEECKRKETFRLTGNDFHPSFLRDA